MARHEYYYRANVTSCLSHPIAVTIGLDAVLYIENESAATVIVSVSVLSGTLGSSATLVLNTEDNTATSKTLQMMYKINYWLYILCFSN